MSSLGLELSLVGAGLAAAAVLFYKIPGLPKSKPTDPAEAGRPSEAGNPARGMPTVSVIIPARNEEANLPHLLTDLAGQSTSPLEVICVDDASEDRTAQIAESFQTHLIKVTDKPEGWVGKSWACQTGAEQAAGDLLLFLDADVRLAGDGLERLMAAFMDCRCTVSVQPFHETREAYEELSMMFNVLQVGSTGMALPAPYDLGLYGPVILIPRADYWKVGGHETVRTSVVDDVALGMALKQAGLPYRLFLGDAGISFRMYSAGFQSLIQGWTKNLASGALRMPWPLFVLVFLWITSMTSVPVQTIRYALLGSWDSFALFMVLYGCWVVFLTGTARRIGRFPLWTIVAYPVSLSLLIIVFSVSLFMRTFGLKVVWKGRTIQTREKS